MLKKPKTPVQCRYCKHAALMQWWDNPIIAQCDVTGEREVAETKRLCETFEKRVKAEIVEHFNQYN